MTTETERLQTLSRIPEQLKQETLRYAKYLIDNYSATMTEPHPNQAKNQPPKRRSGILQGTFVLPLPDDFDEPLEDFLSVPTL